MSTAQAVLGDLGIDAQALAGIAVMARIMRNATVRVAQRHYCHFIPKEAAVLAIVAQQHSAGFSAAHGIAQPMAPILLSIIGLQ